MSSSDVSISDNIRAFNRFMDTITTIRSKTRNLNYISNKNLTTISGIVNCEALGVLGKPVALKEDLNTKANTNHNHDSAYASVNHTHSLDEVVLTYDEEEDYEEETLNEEEELVYETKTRTITVHKGLDELLDEREADIRTLLNGKANSNHNHDSSYASINHTHNYAASSHSHSISDITDLLSSLDGKASSSHNHDSIYAKLSADNTFTGRQFFNSAVSMNSLEIVKGLSNNDENVLVIGENKNNPYSGSLVYHKNPNNNSNYFTIGISGNPALKFTETNTTALLPITSSSTITGSNVLSDNETRLAACESGLSGKASSSHSHSISDITNLQTSLDGKASSSHNHDSSYASINHDHDSSYAALSHSHSISDITNLQSSLDGKASSSHNHDSTYAKLSADNTITGVKQLLVN